MHVDRDYQEYAEMIEMICLSKKEEFHLLGYDSLTEQEIWNFVSKDYQEVPYIHRIANDIFKAKITDMMNWMTLNAFKGSMFTASEDKETV